jgi:para-nitrobenzyl esterase
MAINIFTEKMMRIKSFTSFGLIALAAYGVSATSAAFAQVAPTQAAPAAAKPKYSTAKTQLGTLLEDPAAKAVLQKHVPKLVDGGGQNMDQASGMTLRELQAALKAYAPDLLTDKVLQDIDTDLAALPQT